MNNKVMKQYEKLQDQKSKAENQLTEIAEKEAALRESLLADVGRELMTALKTEDILVAQAFIDDLKVQA